MKLQELGAQRPSQQIADLIENHFGQRIDLDQLTRSRAGTMLQRVSGLLREYRHTPLSHNSEKDPAYLRLLMLERGLRARIREQDQPMAIDVDSPDTQRTLKKAASGQNLNPDEVKTVSAVATMKTQQKESRRRRLREQNELQQAQVVLASQDMIDRIQGMLEDISEMQFKDLPALTDSIKQDIGTEQASQFSAQASQALSTLLTAVQAGKAEMEAAQGTITGEAIAVPGQETQPGGMPGMPGELPGAEAEPMAAIPPEATGVAPEPAALGRERR